MEIFRCNPTVGNRSSVTFHFEKSVCFCKARGLTALLELVMSFWNMLKEALLCKPLSPVSDQCCNGFSFHSKAEHWAYKMHSFEQVVCVGISSLC